ncbi:MAG: hypothetical protein H0W74_14050 [Sphingosinicella sp.]|nr:hypothetical protein [Sphingosinicella sp.]
MTQVLPTDARARKDTPITTGVLDYFPRALAAIARVSKAGNDQHNPGQPLHWAREKSTDHADCIVRHLLERGTVDNDGQRHSAKLAWRALALLETELERTAPAAWEDQLLLDLVGLPGVSRVTLFS